MPRIMHHNRSRPCRLIRPTVILSLLALVNVFLASPVLAERPTVHSVFPLGIPKDKEVELAFTGNSGLASATRIWSPQVQLDAKLHADSKGLRWSCRATVAEPIGYFDLYVISPHGVSPPVRLELSEFPEVFEESLEADRVPSEASQVVTVPVIVNGKLDPGTDRDEYRFVLRQGQPLHLLFRSMSLGSNVAGALTLFDPQGREILHDDGRSPEPRLSFVALETGEYRVRVHERAYRKGSRTGYRLWMLDRPPLLAAFPHVLQRGQLQEVTLYTPGLDESLDADGAPVSMKRLVATVTSPGKADRRKEQEASPVHSIGSSLDYHHPDLVGFVPFGLSDNSLVIEDEELSDSPETAQVLELPADIAGRFHRLRDQDWYRFRGNQDDTLWIEAYGERFGQEMDLEIDIHDDSGKRLTTLTDTAAIRDRSDSWGAATLDPSVNWKVPADGEYRLIIRDLYGASLAGPDRHYRLRIGSVPPPPVLLVTESVHLRPGERASLEIHRHGTVKEGHALKIHAEGLPVGVSAGVVRMDAEAATGLLEFSASDEAPSWIGPISLRAVLMTADEEGPGEPVAIHYVTVRDRFYVPHTRVGPILVVENVARTD